MLDSLFRLVNHVNSMVFRLFILMNSTHVPAEEMPLTSLTLFELSLLSEFYSKVLIYYDMTCLSFPLSKLSKDPNCQYLTREKEFFQCYVFM